MNTVVLEMGRYEYYTYPHLEEFSEPLELLGDPYET
jgi:hypothetical protein